MQRPSIATDIVGGRRQHQLDLHDAVTRSQHEKPKVAMNDVFRYGYAAKMETVAEPEKVSAAQERPRTSQLRQVWAIAQYPLVALVAIGGAYSTSIGQWFVLAYAIYAVWRRVDSRYSFGTALFLLVTVPLFQLIGQSGIAQNAAVYVFELLVIGTAQAVWELRKVEQTAS